MSSSMPASQQTWAHATNSSRKLQDALRDPNVTAIEADLLCYGSARNISANAWLDRKVLKEQTQRDAATRGHSHINALRIQSVSV